MSDPVTSLRERTGILGVALEQWADQASAVDKAAVGMRPARWWTRSMPCSVTSTCCAGALSRRSARPTGPTGAGLLKRAARRIAGEISEVRNINAVQSMFGSGLGDRRLSFSRSNSDMHSCDLSSVHQSRPSSLIPVFAGVVMASALGLCGLVRQVAEVTWQRFGAACRWLYSCLKCAARIVHLAVERVEQVSPFALRKAGDTCSCGRPRSLLLSQFATRSTKEGAAQRA
jgi:hypothetical protein